ncbi:MAG: DUF4339 domain-containing protein [Verrucomicrobia bacterium]|nr:DUF4339 domain-containing protein [Verrucomicrobiota bacterium]
MGVAIWLFFANPVPGPEVVMEDSEDPLGFLEKREFVLAHDRRQVGPMSWPELRSLVESGRLPLTDRFWHEGLTSWRPVKQISRLLQRLQTSDSKSATSAPVAKEGIGALLEQKRDDIPMEIAVDPNDMAKLNKPERDVGAALGLYGLAALIFVVGVLIMYQLFHAERGDSNRTAAGNATMTLIMPICYYLVYKGKKLAARSAYDMIRRDSRKPVLFLRSFADDGERIQAAGYADVKTAKTEESVMVKKLKALGPVVAIGRPGEELAEIGAARMYVPHANWQEVALLLMKHSRCVVMKAGDTPGLHWEMSALRQSADPRKVVIRIPKAPKLREGFSDLKEDKEGNKLTYQRFRESIYRSMKVELPEMIEEFNYIAFDRNWRPRPVKYMDDAPEEFQRRYTLLDFWRDSAGVNDLVNWFRRFTPPGIRHDTEAQRLLEAIRPFC